MPRAGNSILASLERGGLPPLLRTIPHLQIRIQPPAPITPFDPFFQISREISALVEIILRKLTGFLPQGTSEALFSYLFR